MYRNLIPFLKLPNGTNILIVVSFGLFVPKRILNSAKYGGLNVHPSLLPEYVPIQIDGEKAQSNSCSLRGPAPIHHALLRGSSHTGISLQTLDARAFDHGTVLAQTPSPGIPIPASAALPDFTAQLAVKGAEMLVQGLRDGVHVPPHVDAGWKAAELEGEQLAHAPKIDKAAARVEWDSWTAVDWTRRIRVLGSVWANGVIGMAKHKGDTKRVLFLDAEAVAEEQVQGDEACMAFAGAEKQSAVDGRIHEVAGSCSMKLPSGDWIRIQRVKVDGKTEQDAAVALKQFRQV
jgi:methionyl-tRNA formyltransferase